MTNPHPTTTWAGAFGEAYTDRNPKDIAVLDALYVDRYGVTRSDINREFIGSLDRSVRVLEVGSNVGLQLQGLSRLGFEHLYGVEVMGYAVRQARLIAPDAKMAQGSAFAIPFGSGVFDLVFTSALLIHIPPKQLGQVLDEIYRCSRAFIWGWEYYADMYTNVVYRGNDNLLWKTNFAQAYLDRFPGLTLVHERRLRHSDSENLDTVFLLKKTVGDYE